MVQGRRRGLVHTKEISLEYELGRVQKERRSEAERVSDAEKTDDKIPTWEQMEAAGRVYPWRIEWCNQSPIFACSME